ncbi:hypothetical protein BJV78DRAFT_1172955, partial [Lactifluus subvellereus]
MKLRNLGLGASFAIHLYLRLSGRKKKGKIISPASRAPRSGSNKGTKTINNPPPSHARRNGTIKENCVYSTRLNRTL